MGIEVSNLPLNSEGAVNVGGLREAAQAGRLFSAANQAAQATTVGLATTYTGLCLSNPPGSGKDLILHRAGFAITTGEVAISSVGLMGGFSTIAGTGGITHTTPIVPNACRLDRARGVALVDAAATIPTPVCLEHIEGGFTAGALGARGNVQLDVNGAYVIPPGGFIAIYSLTALSGLGSMVWEEVDN